MVKKLSNELRETQTANNNLQSMLKQQREENDELNVLKDRFQDQCREITTKYNELKVKYDKQQKKLLLDKNYTEWDCNDIVQWLCSIENGRYKKYESKISMAIKDENITGQHLMDIDKNDLHRIGITDFGDKKSVLNHIKSLKVDKNDENDENDVEGVDGTMYH